MNESIEYKRIQSVIRAVENKIATAPGRDLLMGRIDCPVCGQPNGIHYSKNIYTGNITAKCDRGCVSFRKAVC